MVKKLFDAETGQCVWPVAVSLGDMNEGFSASFEATVVMANTQSPTDQTPDRLEMGAQGVNCAPIPGTATTQCLC